MTETQQLEVSRADMLACVEHFKGVPVTDKVLTEYCNLNHIGFISAGVYSDFLAQYNHDKRMESFVPKALAIIAKYQSIPELASETTRKKLLDENEQLETDICKLMEDEGILYQELDIVAQNLGASLQAIMTGAGKRANNMCATMLAHTAREKYGDPLTLKVLGENYRAIADSRKTK